MAHGLFEAFFVARIVQGGGGGGTLCCRFEPPGARGVAVPAPDNLLPFCWPLGVDSVKPSPYLVTCEFSFTLTGGDGQRLHGFCRKTHDPTHRPATGGAKGAASVEHKRFPQVLCILSQHCWGSFYSKVLEVVDQLLAPHAALERLPPDAPAALFMASLPRLVAAAGPAQPPLGAVLRVPLPYSGAPIVVDRMRRALGGDAKGDLLLGLAPDCIELEVPPSLGNSTANAGVSLARLLWFLTPRQAVSLVASLLLERRVILVARDADTVSAAVHAANALLYPFRWQHIFLPLLPLALKDYLAAPMPYLAGVQAECLPLLRGLPLEEVVVVDLDTLGSVTPAPGSPGDDARLLPYARELEDVFEVVREHMRSPTEFDSTPKCTELVQDFFLRLVGRYRQFVRPDEEVTPAALALGLDRALPSSHSSQTSSRGGAEDNPRAHGFVFDQAAFVAAHKRKDRLAAFLAAFRSSQMLEVFVTERLKLASEGYITEDPFELKVTERNMRASIRLGIPGVGGAATQKGRIGSLLRKAGSAVKLGGGSLVASIQRLGTSQQEEVHVPGRVASVPTLARLSPAPDSLARVSPSIRAAAVVAHSHGSSAGGSKPASRSGSFTGGGGLNRVSASLAVLNGGVQPSLEQLRPDMFFGADDDDDDGGSVISEGTSATLEAPAAARQAAARNGPGPLEKAFGASRSFGVLHGGIPTHPGPRGGAAQAGGSRLGGVDAAQPVSAAATAGASFMGLGSLAAHSSVLGPLAQMSISPPSSHAAALDGKAEGGAAAPAAPASLIDLHSPSLVAARPQQRAQGAPQPRPQQLFADATAAAAAAWAPVALGAHCSESRPGWATFEEPAAALAPRADALAATRERGGGGASVLEASVGPLGLAMSGAALGGSSSSLPPLEPGLLRQPASLPAQLTQAPPQQPPWQAPQPAGVPPAAAPHLPASLSLPLPRRGQQQQQPAAQTEAAPSPIDGVSAGWGPMAVPLPPVCRHTAHSPLGQGMDVVHHLASLNAEARRRNSGGAVANAAPRPGSGGGMLASVAGLHVQPDAFADVAVAAAVQVAEGMPAHRQPSRTSSLASNNPFRDPAPPLAAQRSGGRRTLTTTSSFGEWSSAWPISGDGPLGSGAPVLKAVPPPAPDLSALLLAPR